MTTKCKICGEQKYITGIRGLEDKFSFGVYSTGEAGLTCRRCYRSYLDWRKNKYKRDPEIKDMMETAKAKYSKEVDYYLINYWLSSRVKNVKKLTG